MTRTMKAAWGGLRVSVIVLGLKFAAYWATGSVSGVAVSRPMPGRRRRNSSAARKCWTRASRSRRMSRATV
jgi:hypothetical protein